MSSDVTRLIICGAGGRMGARLCRAAHEDPALRLAGALEAAGASAAGRAACEPGARGDAPRISTDEKGFTAGSADVVVDFSSEAGALRAAALAQRLSAALLVGTTGLSPGAVESLRAASRQVAVLLAPNTSLGVAVLSDLVRRAAAALGPGFSGSITEAHHSAKKDAPSGTALRLAEAARRGGATLPAGQIVSIRGGDVIGEHTVRFAGPGEYLELTHRATSRDLFVAGALRAAAWLRGKPAGWYAIEEALGAAPSR